LLAAAEVVRLLLAAVAALVGTGRTGTTKLLVVAHPLKPPCLF